MGHKNSLRHWEIWLGVCHLRPFHLLPEASFTMGFQELGGVLANFNMVGIWIHPSFTTTTHGFVCNSVYPSICLVSLYDHQGCPGAAGHYLCSLRLHHLGWDSSSPLWQLTVRDWSSLLPWASWGYDVGSKPYWVESSFWQRGPSTRSSQFSGYLEIHLPWDCHLSPLSWTTWLMLQVLLMLTWILAGILPFGSQSPP